LRSNPPEAAGNRHKSAHGKKTLAKSGDLGDSHVYQTLSFPGLCRYARPALQAGFADSGLWFSSQKVDPIRQRESVPYPPREGCDSQSSLKQDVFRSIQTGLSRVFNLSGKLGFFQNRNSTKFFPKTCLMAFNYYMSV
jgi:hypothetical protein